MTSRWSLNDFDWSLIKRDGVDEHLVQTIKTAALVEANSADYVQYLHNVFDDDEAFRAEASEWGREEAQHGAALARWCEEVDPEFEFETALARFREGYRIPVDAEDSVRGSQTGELLARCVVETGTFTFYSAIRDHTEDPVLKQICACIAQDEARHYRLFREYMDRYNATRRLGVLKRIRVALGRINETDDDELAYAFYAANGEMLSVPYDRKHCADAYWARALGFYRPGHVRNAVQMVSKALGMSGKNWFAETLWRSIWRVIQWRLRRVRTQLAGTQYA